MDLRIKCHLSKDLKRVRAELCSSWSWRAGPTEGAAKPEAGAGQICLEVAQQEVGSRT